MTALDAARLLTPPPPDPQADRHAAILYAALKGAHIPRRGQHSGPQPETENT